MIRSARLELVPGTIESVGAARAGAAALGSVLDARIPSSWPPDFVDDAAFEWTLERLREGGEDGWWLYFVLFRVPPALERVLIGTGGYKGPPTEDGSVEAGYGIVSEYRRRGFASEACEALVSHAFDDPRVRRVLAETLPELVGSIGVLEKCGFRFIGEGSELGVIRYERRRPGSE